MHCDFDGHGGDNGVQENEDAYHRRWLFSSAIGTFAIVLFSKAMGRVLGPDLPNGWFTRRASARTRSLQAWPASISDSLAPLNPKL